MKPPEMLRQPRLWSREAITQTLLALVQKGRLAKGRVSMSPE
jgi:hypothetical protein